MHPPQDPPNAREEQQMSNENETQNEVVGTAANLIQEAARVVNWTPDEKHSQQARYDAHRAMMGMFAYWTAVAMETLRRLDPAIAEAVATHIDNDLDWPTAHEHAYGWEQTLNAGDSIAVDAWPFWEITGQPDSQPAGEHHVGTLDLSGEGNGPAPVVSDATIEATAKVLYESPPDNLSRQGWESAPKDIQAIYRTEAQSALEAAYPAIRQQVAEEIAVALAEMEGYDGNCDCQDCVSTARLVEVAREIGAGVARGTADGFGS